jgi:hypothetical protein
MQGGSIRNRTRHLDALVNPSLQRIKPIRTQQWNLALDSDILGHGVISSGGANRRVLRCELGDYAIGRRPVVYRSTEVAAQVREENQTVV